MSRDLPVGRQVVGGAINKSPPVAGFCFLNQLYGVKMMIGREAMSILIASRVAVA
jgi:hypothetical protein